MWAKEEKDDNHSSFQRDKLFAAIFYGVSSVLVIFTNKWLLTEFHFPHFKFVAAVQFITTSIILWILSVFKRVDIPVLSYQIFREILPVSLMFLGNVLCGLGSTKALNIPMFTALRRFSIMMTMLGEWWFLNQAPATSVVVSVALMVGGAFVAALYDLSFDAFGYTMVFLNNVFTAMNGVWMRKAALSGKCSKMGVLYYNSLFSGIIMLIYFFAEHKYYSDLRNPSTFVSGVVTNLESITNPVSGVDTARSRSMLQMSSPSNVDFTESNLYVTLVQEYGTYSSGRFLAQADSTASSNMQNHDFVHNALNEAKARLNALNQQVLQESNRFSLLNHGEQSSKQGQQSPAGVNLRSRVGEKELTEMRDTNSIQNSMKSIENASTISQVMAFPGWRDWKFITMLLCTCCMGSVLNYAIFLCTTRNSALTTAVVGTLKNVATTYIGMLVFSDYTFTWINFIGINISIVGSVYYTLVAMKS